MTHAAVILEPVQFRPTKLFEDLPQQIKRGLQLLLMAGTKSDYLEDKIKNEVLGGVAFASVTPIFFGLWTSALTDASTSATAGEVSGGSYARVSVTNNTTNFATVTGSAKVNSTTIAFPTASASWGTVTYVGVFDVASGAGNMFMWADLTTSKTVASGDTAQFNAGDFSWTED